MGDCSCCVIGMCNKSEVSLMFEDYLKAMQGSTAQNPMKASDLLLPGQSNTTLLVNLNEMYERGMINRASITKKGQTDLVVWLTGIVKQYNSKTDFKISPPRRDEQPMQPVKKATESIKSEAIAKFVVENKEVTKDQIYKQFPVPAGRPYDYVYKLIWALVNSKTLALKKAEQAKDDVLSKGLQYDKFIEKINKKSPKGPIINIPTADEYAVADSVDEKLGQGTTIDEFNKKLELRTDALYAEAGIKITPEKLAAADIPVLAVLSKTAEPELTSEFKEGLSETEYLINSLVPHVPDGCKITLQKPIFETVIVEIDGTMLANPITTEVKHLNQALIAIKTLQQVCNL